MTNETETVNSQNHNTLHIPSREEFHRILFLLDKIKVLESLNRLKEIKSVKRNYIWKKLLIKKDVRNMRRSKNCIVF